MKFPRRADAKKESLCTASQRTGAITNDFKSAGVAKSQIAFPDQARWLMPLGVLW
jgi:hypothetical protein